MSMRLEPPIHRLIDYAVLPVGLSRRKEIPTGMKELLAHQVRLASLSGKQQSLNSEEAGTVVQHEQGNIEADESETLSASIETPQPGSPGPNTTKSSDEMTSTIVTPKPIDKASSATKVIKVRHVESSSILSTSISSETCSELTALM